MKINSCICDGSASVGKFNHGTTLNNVPWIDWFVKCSRCERGIPGGTKKEAIQLWNSVNPIHDQARAGREVAMGDLFLNTEDDRIVVRKNWSKLTEEEWDEIMRRWYENDRASITFTDTTYTIMPYMTFADLFWPRRKEGR